jgi:tetratricopeptide (TPR) repeat protein
MPEETRDPRSVVQGAFRRRRGWSVEELATACGDSKAVVAGNEAMAGSPPALKTLKSRVEVMGYAPSIVDLAVEVVALAPGGNAAPGSPLDPPPEEARTLRERALQFGVRAFRLMENALEERRYQRRVEEHRAEAQKRVEELLAHPSSRWPLLIAGGPAYQGWAVVERLCDLSRMAASDDVKRALQLAELALHAAQHVRGPESWRDRLSGMAWGFIGNANRVASDHRSADKAFRTAWTLWKKGYQANLPLGDWRLLDLEASLRRDERLWPETIDLHQRALATAPESAQGSILVNLAYAFDQMLEPDRALATLLKAEPLVEKSEDPRLPLVLRFNLVTTYLALGRLDEAEARLPEVRAGAVVLGRELDLVRTLWLQGRLDAARGRRSRALGALTQVMREFRAREIAYDSALAGLEVAVLYLETGAVDKAQRLAGELVWVFAAHQVSREALAALRVFCDAAESNCLTVELARQAALDFRRAGSSSALSEIE